MGSEKNFETKLKRWLELQGIYALGTPKQDMVADPCGYWEKRWGGGKYVKSGLPDMHIVVNGINLDVELKAPNGKPSELQVQKLNQIDDAGSVAIVLYPKDFDNFKHLIGLIQDSSDIPDMRIVVDHFGLERGWRK